MLKYITNIVLRTPSLQYCIGFVEVPEAPSNVNIDQSSSRSIRVTWEAPYNGNSPITAYFIEYKNVSGK